jgi:hypothetical protein
LGIVWPFGEGVLVTGYGVERGIGVFVVYAVPDGHTRDEGGDGVLAWDAARDMGAPHIALTFKDASSVRNLADELQHLATALESSALAPVEDRQA